MIAESRDHYTVSCWFELQLATANKRSLDTVMTAKNFIDASSLACEHSLGLLRDERLLLTDPTPEYLV
jgi:hypothetical protein